MNNVVSIKKTARIAGFLYFLQIPLGVFGIIYVPQVLVIPNDFKTTVSNILSHEFLFRLSIVSAILCSLATVATAYFIHKVLEAVNPKFSKMIVIFALIVTPISMLNELNNVAILLILKNPDAIAQFSENQIQTMITFFLDLHHYGMQLIGIFFGLWLLPMGYLVIKSGYIPKVIGVFLLITCIGYLLDFINFFLFLEIKIVFSEYTWLGEVMMVSWLLIKGVRLEEYNKKNTISQQSYV